MPDDVNWSTSKTVEGAKSTRASKQVYSGLGWKSKRADGLFYHELDPVLVEADNW